MRFHDEVRDPPKAPGKRPAKAQLDTTVKLIEAMSEPWDPANYRDEYEQRLKKIIRDKQKGKTVKEPERPEQPSPIEDLMAALERSLEEVSA
jgi:DNA end-binding protein Ku